MSSDLLSPGVGYILREAPRLFFPPAFVVAAHAALRALSGVSLPIWLQTVACILSYPVSLALSVQWKQFRDARAAAALGAVLPPKVQTKLPGGLDLVLMQNRNVKNKFLGMSQISCDCGSN